MPSPAIEVLRHSLSISGQSSRLPAVFTVSRRVNTSVSVAPSLKKNRSLNASVWLIRITSSTHAAAIASRPCQRRRRDGLVRSITIRTSEAILEPVAIAIATATPPIRTVKRHDLE